MKPAMPRDVLVAYWFLFDEFVLDPDDHPAAEEASGEEPPAAKPAKAPPSS